MGPCSQRCSFRGCWNLSSMAFLPDEHLMKSHRSVDAKQRCSAEAYNAGYWDQVRLFADAPQIVAEPFALALWQCGCSRRQTENMVFACCVCVCHRLVLYPDQPEVPRSEGTSNSCWMQIMASRQHGGPITWQFSGADCSLPVWAA